MRNNKKRRETMRHHRVEMWPMTLAMRDGRTDEQTTREDSAAQLLICETLSFAIYVQYTVWCKYLQRFPRHHHHHCGGQCNSVYTGAHIVDAGHLLDFTGLHDSNYFNRPNFLGYKRLPTNCYNPHFLPYEKGPNNFSGYVTPGYMLWFSNVKHDILTPRLFMQAFPGTAI